MSIDELAMAVESNQNKITDNITAVTGIAMDMIRAKKTEVPSAAPSISTAPTANCTQTSTTSHSPTNVYKPSAFPTMSVTLSISTSATLTVPPTSMTAYSPSCCPTTPAMKNSTLSCLTSLTVSSMTGVSKHPT